MKIEPTNLLKAQKERPDLGEGENISDAEKVEAANELHEWLNACGK